MLADLAHAGLRPHSLAPVFERVKQQRGTALLPDNLHPTAATYDAVADYVVREVLQLDAPTQ